MMSLNIVLRGLLGLLLCVLWLEGADSTPTPPPSQNAQETPDKFPARPATQALKHIHEPTTLVIRSQVAITWKKTYCNVKLR